MNKISSCALMAAIFFGTGHVAAAPKTVENVTFKSPWSRTAITPDAPGTPAAALAAEIASAPVSADGRKLWIDSLKLRALRTGNQQPISIPNFKKEGGFSVAIDRNSDTAYYTNNRVGLAVAGVDSGKVRIVSLYDFASRIDWITETADSAYLWDITLRKGEENIRQSSLVKADQFSFTHRLEKGNLLLTGRWLMTPPAGIGGKYVVNTEIEIIPDSPIAKWRIAVDNQLTDAGLWEVVYPFIQGIGKSGQVDCVDQTRFYHGVSKQVGSQLWAVQVLPLMFGDSTLYVGANDPKHFYKRYTMKPGNHLALKVYVPDMGETGVSYRQSYDFLIGPIKGDWYDAAQIYREWALQQSWCAKGKVEQWSAASPEGRMRDTMLWVTTMYPLGKTVAETAKVLREMKDFFGVATGAHYYHWWGSNGAFVPNTLWVPEKDGYTEGSKSLMADKIEMMPYINVLHYQIGFRTGTAVWPDVRIEDKAYKLAPQLWCKSVVNPPEIGRKIDDHYLVYVGNNVFAPACRSTQAWRDILNQLSVKVGDTGADMIYLDQGFSSQRWCCFDKTHGHPAGSGCFWADGTYEMTRQIKNARGAGKPFALSAEGIYEGYIDLVEMHLQEYMTGHDELRAPLFHSIYSGYTLYMAGGKYPEDIRTFTMKMASWMLYGSSFRIDTNFFKDPKYQKHIEMLKKLLTVMHEYRGFLHQGTLLKPPVWAKEPPTMEVDWIRQRKAPKRLTAPSMERGYFRASDGREAVFAANFENHPQSAELKLNRAPAKVVDYQGRNVDFTYENGIFSAKVPAQEVIIIEFNK